VEPAIDGDGNWHSGSPARVSRFNDELAKRRRLYPTNVSRNRAKIPGWFLVGTARMNGRPSRHLPSRRNGISR
jgi:hypothetical protein